MNKGISIRTMMEEYRIPINSADGKTVYRAGKLVCIGRNYAKHAAELGNAVPSSPMIFLKPASALISSGGSILIPSASQDVHHEVELVCLIGAAGSDISRENALNHVAGYAVGLDMTARDIQLKAKEKGHPWSVAKGYDTFAPLGDFVPASAVPDPQDLTIRLEINGQERQAGHTGDMIFPVDELIAYASTIFTLQPGDLLFTGTPEGVGPVSEGDRLTASVEGLPDLDVDVKRRG